MIIKCGRKEFDLTTKDQIMYNGHCYQIITRLTSGGWSGHSPIIAKTRAEKLIKDGKLVFSHKWENNIHVDIYKIAE